MSLLRGGVESFSSVTSFLFSPFSFATGKLIGLLLSSSIGLGLKIDSSLTSAMTSIGDTGASLDIVTSEDGDCAGFGDFSFDTTLRDFSVEVLLSSGDFDLEWDRIRVGIFGVTVLGEGEERVLLSVGVAVDWGGGVTLVSSDFGLSSALGVAAASAASCQRKYIIMPPVF